MKVKKYIRIVGRPERAHPGARRHMIHFTPDPNSNSDPPPDRNAVWYYFSIGPLIGSTHLARVAKKQLRGKDAF